MIGVIAKPQQIPVAEEFFELFKTPWEQYRSGRQYDVVITSDECPEVYSKLLLVYGPAWKSIDKRIGTAPLQRGRDTSLLYGDSSLPIYGDVLTFVDANNGVSCRTASGEIAGFRAASAQSTVIRLGYDLFDEVQWLLSEGQPVEHARIPTLDLHIKMLRDWILAAGIPLLEIPPAPAGHSFAVCLTHDIDFIGIRNHLFDHSMWGFVYRATIGALRNFSRGRLSLTRLIRNWLAVARLPLVYAGWARDFWEPFEWYLRAEQGLAATYFVIPFKRRSGDHVPGPRRRRRATAYDVSDLPERTQNLLAHGCEIGVHGIDAWHNAENGREERARISSVTGQSDPGVRMHWLLRDPETPSVLEQAGYAYDSSCGYNETIGYRAGTGQVFRPLEVRALLELPLHIQDGALFYPQRLDLSEPEAEKRCEALIDHCRRFGGVLTLLWHDRSHGPERYWGDFYVRILQRLKSLQPWFGTGAQVVNWFRKRREVRFENVDRPAGVRFRYEGGPIQPPLTVRLHLPTGRRTQSALTGELRTELLDFCWNGKSADELELKIAAALLAGAQVLCSAS